MSDAPRTHTPPVLAIRSQPGELIFAVHPDGRLEYGPGYDPDDAARRFWAALAVHMPVQQASDELVTLREDNARLRGVLAEVMAQFVHTTHPGAPCLQTGHVDVSTVERWRKAVRP